MELKDRLEKIEREVDPIRTKKGDLEAKVKIQQTRVKLVEKISFNRAGDSGQKLAAEARRNYAAELLISYQGEETNLVIEMQTLAEIEAELARVNAQWDSLQESRFILQSLLGFDKESLKFTAGV